MTVSDLFAIVTVWLLGGLVFEGVVCVRQWRHLGRVHAASPADAALVRHGRRRALFQWLTGFERVARVGFWLGSGALGALFGLFDSYGAPGLIAFVAVFAACDQLLCEIRRWAQWWFVERAGGMSRSGAGTIALDSARRVAINSAVAILACIGVLWPFAVWPFGWAWVVSGVLMIVGMALLFWARPNLIAPLFERFTALEPGELRTRLEAMMKRCDTRLDQVLVVETSRRSRVANAYFTGLGRSKRVVLSDTLIDALSAAELEAVMAHELGHYRCGHLQRFYTSQAALLLGGYLAIGAVAGLTALAVAPVVLAAAAYLLLAALAWPLQLWQSARRRRYEYEADAYAAAHADAGALVSALEKLLANNLTAPTMDAWYAMVFATHPPGASRLDRLRADNG